MFGGEEPVCYFLFSFLFREREVLHWRAIVRTQKPYAFFSHLGQFQQRDHLEPTLVSNHLFNSKMSDEPPAIRQNIPIPALQPMRTAHLVQHRLAGL